MASDTPHWPDLPYEELAATVDHLHRLSQIGGKYTLDELFEPSWGNIVLAVTPRGLATPTLRAGELAFQVLYELLDDRVTLLASTGTVSLPLAPGSVAAFYASFIRAAASLGIPAPRSTVQPEIPDAPPLDEDHEPRAYDPAAARAIWAALAGAAGGLEAWQAPYRGHRPRVGLMWGAFDLSATRFRARPLEPPRDRPPFMQHGMAEEVVAVGFSFGNAASPQAALYAYISPPPDALAERDLGVPGAAFVPEAGLFATPWEVVRAARDPRAAVVAFADAVYAAAVELGGWPEELVGPRFDGWHASTHPPPAVPSI